MSPVQIANHVPGPYLDTTPLPPTPPGQSALPAVHHGAQLAHNQILANTKGASLTTQTSLNPCATLQNPKTWAPLAVHCPPPAEASARTSARASTVRSLVRSSRPAPSPSADADPQRRRTRPEKDRSRNRPAPASALRCALMIYDARAQPRATLPFSPSTSNRYRDESLRKFAAGASSIRRESPSPDTMELYAKTYGDSHF